MTWQQLRLRKNANRVTEGRAARSTAYLDRRKLGTCSRRGLMQQKGRRRSSTPLDREACPMTSWPPRSKSSLLTNNTTEAVWNMMMWSMTMKMTTTVRTRMMMSREKMRWTAMRTSMKSHLPRARDRNRVIRSMQREERNNKLSSRE